MREAQREPHSAVKLVVKNPHLKEAGVIVDQFIGDKDSSTIAALRRESTHHITKITDLNHNTKSFNNALWNLKKSTQRWLTSAVIDYLKKLLNYAIHQNKNNVDGVRAAIMNIEKHTFGEHDGCGSWCNAKSDPEN